MLLFFCIHEKSDMMAGVTYKCPSCGAYLAFDPAEQKWKCDFCESVFTEEDLLPKSDAFAQAAAREQSAPEEAENEVLYHCPSCGSEIMTGETTVATHCYYCHNPVVLQGKLTAGMKPEQVLPFAIGKEDAVKKFMDWAGKKKFIPRAFFSEQGVQEMSGVYYPHFVTECEMDGSFQGEGRNISRMDTPTHIVTKTDYYTFRRRANIVFRNVMRPALKSADRKLSDGIHPFPLEAVKPFSSAYLSGFLAERRDIDSADIAENVQSELKGYIKPMLAQSLHYSSYSGEVSATALRQNSRYVLLPTWVLTYKGRKDPKGQVYYYAMNGATGAVCGKLPIDKGKLLRFGLLVGGAVFAALCLGGYFLW